VQIPTKRQGSVRLATILCLLISFTFTTRANATVILVVVKPDAIWVGTDGLRGPMPWHSVCKAHEVYGGVLLKFGIDGDPHRTFSSDADIKHLLDTKKSFAEFQPAAADIMGSRVDQETKAKLAEVKRSHPDLFLDDAISIEPTTEDAFRVDMGLAFITVLNGKLAIYELFAEPTVQTVTGSDGSKRYRWFGEKPKWSLRNRKEEVVVYPQLRPGESLPQELLERLIADPQTNIQNEILSEEQTDSCAVGRPNLLMKVTYPVLDPKVHHSRSARIKVSKKVAVEYLDHGACPSWEALPVARPDRCTDAEFKREICGK
jgi:hypothetical protein